MGIERTVTLWYLHRQVLLNELALLEAQLVQIRAISDSEVAQSEVREGAEERRKRVQERLHDLGPCPRPMMG
jgi:hypothetical protein